MRLIFMGTPPFAAKILAGLQKHGYDVVAAYTQPPRRAGRGHHVMKSAVHEYAESCDIPVLSPLSFKDEKDIATFNDFKADIAIVAAYGLLLPTSILQAPRLGCLNIHASLLPRWRGAAPIQYALLSGDAETGITLMKMDAGLDTGPMIAKNVTALSDQTTAEKLTETLAEMGQQLLLDSLPSYAAGTMPLTDQPETGITHAPKITKEMGALAWGQSATDLERKIRALNPWPGTWCTWNGGRLKILDATVTDADQSFPAEQQGAVVNDMMAIACSTGILHPTLVQKPGSKAIPIADFLRGNPVAQGSKLEMPS